MSDGRKFNDIIEFLVAPDAESNKYSRGVVGFATGSVEYPGAAVLGVTAAMRTGVGLVRYIGPSSVAAQVLNHRPETVTVPGGANAWVIGSGQPENSEPSEHQRDAINSGVPIVVDAGALNHAHITHSQTVATPHVGELTRLLAANGYEVSPQQVSGAPARYARIAAERFGCTFILKGSVNYIANQHGQLLTVGPTSPWLATAGTGDVLAGILGALLATNSRMLEAHPDRLIEIAAAAAVLHAEAASILAERGPILALDLADAVAAVVAGAFRV